MKTRYYYYQWIAALMVFVGIPLHVRYKSFVSITMIFIGILFTVLFFYLDFKKRNDM